MAKLKPSDIVISVMRALKKAKRKHGELSFLTAYQILDRLPKTVKARLIRERGLGGKGRGIRYAAPSVVSKAAQIAGAEVRYLDTKDIELTMKEGVQDPTPRLCGIFRLKEVEN